MNGFETATWLLGAVLTLSWLAIIRRHVIAGHGLMKNHSNTAMFWMCALLLVGVLPSLSALHLVWMFPLGWLVGALSVRVVPLSLFGAPGELFGNLCCIGLDKSVIALNTAKYDRFQELVEVLDYSPKEAREVIAREFDSSTPNTDFRDDDGQDPNPSSAENTRPTHVDPSYQSPLLSADPRAGASRRSTTAHTATSAEIRRMIAIAWDIWQRSNFEVVYPKGTMTLGIVAMMLEELEEAITARERNPEPCALGHESPSHRHESTGNLLDDLRELAARGDALVGRCPRFDSRHFHGQGSEGAIAAILDDMVAHAEATVRRATMADVLQHTRGEKITPDHSVRQKT